MSSSLVSPPIVKAKALNCPNCGSAIEIRGFAHTLSAVCPSCNSIIDTSTTVLTILQTVQIAQRIQPTIPLGTRGKFENTVFEVIGFQVRGPTDAPEYSWSEYLLFNPYKGFRYLSEYRGHWNYIRVQTALPETTMIGLKRGVRMLGRTYRAFDSVNAVTSYVLGEFPWRAKVGETVYVEDFIAPPYMLSSETTDGEVVWSLGVYHTGDEIWKAFQLPGRAPRASGIFANQPSPYGGSAGSSWRIWLWLMVALCAIAAYFSITSSNKKVFENSYSFPSFVSTDAAFVTDPFEVNGRPSNIQILIKTNLSNNWVYFNLALINADDGHTLDFGREVSYYSGADSDGSWTEGSTSDSVKIPRVPNGRYYLRVEPEMDANPIPVTYSIVILRGVPSWSWFWIAALLLIIPPFYITIRSSSFETTRWRDSEFVPAGVSAGGKDEDDD